MNKESLLQQQMRLRIDERSNTCKMEIASLSPDPWRAGVNARLAAMCAFYGFPELRDSGSNTLFDTSPHSKTGYEL